MLAIRGFTMFDSTDTIIADSYIPKTRRRLTRVGQLLVLLAVALVLGLTYTVIHAIQYQGYPSAPASFFGPGGGKSHTGGLVAQDVTATPTESPTATPFVFTTGVPQGTPPATWTIVSADGAYKGYWLPSGADKTKILADWKSVIDNFLVYPVGAVDAARLARYSYSIKFQPTPTFAPNQPTPTAIPLNATFGSTGYVNRQAEILGCWSPTACLVKDTWTKLQDMTFDRSGKLVKVVTSAAEDPDLAVYQATVTGNLVLRDGTWKVTEWNTQFFKVPATQPATASATS